MRASRSQPGRGIVPLRDRGFNQNGDLLTDGTRSILYERRA